MNLTETCLSATATLTDAFERDDRRSQIESRFSVVMPLWNKRDQVVRTVESVLAQSWSNFDLIIVDDGSTDGSVAALAGFDDGRIRIVSQQNAGPGAARNAGIETARSEWIAFLDADDIWLPFHLEELDRIRRSHPDAGMIGTAFAWSDFKGRFDLPADRPGRIATLDYVEERARYTMPFWTSSIALNKAAYRAIGGFRDWPTGQDEEYWVRLGLKFVTAASTRVTAVYVRGTGGISEKRPSHWLGKQLISVADIVPAAQVLLDAMPAPKSAGPQDKMRRLIAVYFDWALRLSLAIGDVATVRALPGLYPWKLPWRQRLLIVFARLPVPIAKPVYNKTRLLYRSLRWRRQADLRSPSRRRGTV